MPRAVSEAELAGHLEANQGPISTLENADDVGCRPFG
jgi:hypothetical protein